ncbi:hypothetical protein ES705_40171 [subsurface metagenome]
MPPREIAFTDHQRYNDGIIFNGCLLNNCSDCLVRMQSFVQMNECVFYIHDLNRGFHPPLQDLSGLFCKTVQVIRPCDEVVFVICPVCNDHNDFVTRIFAQLYNPICQNVANQRVIIRRFCEHYLCIGLNRYKLLFPYYPLHRLLKPCLNRYTRYHVSITLCNDRSIHIHTFDNDTLACQWKRFSQSKYILDLLNMAAVR